MLLALFHFPSAFNSSLVLPPCFQRRLAVLVSFSSLAASSGVSLLLAFAFDRVTQTGLVLSLVWTGWLSAQCRKPLMKKSGAGEGNRTLSHHINQRTIVWDTANPTVTQLFSMNLTRLGQLKHWFNDWRCEYLWGVVSKMVNHNNHSLKIH